MVLLKEVTEHLDATLVEGCRNGDPAAFDALVRRYKDRVYNVAYRFLGNHEDAEDVAQEVFVRAYKGIKGFKGTSKVYTWLYSITGNLSRNKLRDEGRRGRNKGAPLEALESAATNVAHRVSRGTRSADHDARANEMRDILQRCLAELPEHYRMVFVLRTFEELSYDEIAEAVGCPKGTVKSRLNQARALLRDQLRELSIL